MNVRELSSHMPTAEGMLNAVGLARQRDHRIGPPTAFAAFGLGLLLGVGLGLLFQVTADLEYEYDDEDPQPA